MVLFEGTVKVKDVMGDCDAALVVMSPCRNGYICVY